MTTVKASQLSEKPSNRSATSKCPVEDTGKNSVRPSTMPSQTEIKMSCMWRFPGIAREVASRGRPCHRCFPNFWYCKCHGAHGNQTEELDGQSVARSVCA